MEKEDILAAVNAIFVDVLDNEDIKVGYETIANDVEDWDSLTHIELVVAIEKHFKIRFTSQDIMRWENVGEMIDCILRKI